MNAPWGVFVDAFGCPGHRSTTVEVVVVVVDVGLGAIDDVGCAVTASAFEDFFTTKYAPPSTSTRTAPITKPLDSCEESAGDFLEEFLLDETSFSSLASVLSSVDSFDALSESTPDMASSASSSCGRLSNQPGHIAQFPPTTEPMMNVGMNNLSKE